MNRKVLNCQLKKKINKIKANKSLIMTLSQLETSDADKKKKGNTKIFNFSIQVMPNKEET